MRLARSNFLARCFGLLVLVVLAACSGSEAIEEAETFRNGSPESCPGVEDQAALRAELLDALYPDSATDSAMFCALQPGSGACEPQGTHLGGVLPFDGSVPSVAACQEATGTLLLRCDRFAKHVITSALAQGSLIDLLRGVTRLRDVMLRPQVPAYYQLGSPANLFAKQMAVAGVDLSTLGKCIGSSADDGYYCLATDPAAPDRATVRGLLKVLDDHNGILARHGQLAGAADRQANIFASSTGPVATYLARNEVFAPTAGPGVQRVQSLAKVFALRLLDGSAAGSPGSEIDHFLAMKVHQAQGPGAQYLTAGVGLLAAQAAAYAWHHEADVLQPLDLRLVGDLRELFAILRLSSRTAPALEQCVLAGELAEVWRRASSSNLIGADFVKHRFVAHELDALNALHVNDLLSHWDPWHHARIEACQMHQELVAVTATEIVNLDVDSYWYGAEHDLPGPWECVVAEYYTDEAGNEVEIVACDCTEIDWDPLGGGSGGCEQWAVSVEYFDSYDRWIDYGETLAANEVLDEALATTIVKDLVEKQYSNLLSSDELLPVMTTPIDSWYDHTGDGNPDLHHTEDPDDAVSILEAGVGWAECQAELELKSGSYSVTEISDIACDDPELDSDCVTSTLAGPPYDPTPRDFIPYAIAVRVCPEYTALVNGVLDSSFALNECATPWSFTQAVEYFLDHSWAPDEVVATYPEYGSMVKPLAMEFAAESLNLTEGVAAIYRHRAEFASVAGNVPGAVAPASASSWYADNTGLDIVDSQLATGESIIAGGLDLLADFDALTVWGETGTSILTRLFAQGHANCLVGPCEQNNKRHTRALFYRRVRDALETYNRLATARLDVQRRRLDGLTCYDDDGVNGYERCGSCIVAEDTSYPLDGVADALGCDEDLDLDGDGSSDCTFECEYFDTASTISVDGAARLQAVATMLDTHAADAALDAEQSDFVIASADFARGIAGELEIGLQLMLDGVDWLGYRSGQWYPGINIDPNESVLDVSDDIDEKVNALDATLAEANYDTFIRDYLTRVTQLQDWATTVDDAQAEADNTVSDYCSGGLEACDTEWKDTYALVAQINAALVGDGSGKAGLCGRELTMTFYDQDTEQTQDYVVGPALVDCPNFLISPNLEVLMAQYGHLPTQAAALNATLTEILGAIQDIDAYLTMVEKNNAARAELGLLLEQKADVEHKMENIADGIMCGLAVIGAAVVIVAEAACDVTTGVCGALTGGSMIYGAVSGAAAVCGQVYSDESVWFPNAPTQKELERAFHEYAMTLDLNQEEYTVVSKVAGLQSLYARYQLDVVELKSLQAQMARAAAYDNFLFEDIVNSSLFDPAVQLFEEESLGAMRSAFETATRQARDIHHLVEYDLGQSITEGGVFEISPTEKYYFPRLSEITVLKGYGAGFSTAYGDLTTTGGEDGVANKERSINLMSYASLLAHVHDQFTTLYGDRLESYAPVFLGGPNAGLRHVDWNDDGVVDDADELASVNRGDAALLGDSPFHDPYRYVDIVPPGGVECPVGTVDLRDYCDTFSDAVDGQGLPLPVPNGTCLDVATLDVLERYSLAYMDHMTRGEGVQTFECYQSHVRPCVEIDENGLCVDEIVSPYVKVADPGPRGFFTYAELGGVESLIYDTADTDYVNAQTRVVRRIIRRFRQENARSGNIDSDDIEIRPGTYVWLVNMSRSGEAAGVTSANFDPEVHLTYGEADDTMSEQLASMALVCTDPVACADDYNVYSTDVMIFGAGYLGSRCEQRGTHRQARVAFSMDPDAVNVPAVRHTDAAALNEDIDALLETPQARDPFGAQPLHGNGWLLTLTGHSDTNGNQLYDDENEEAAWALYRHIPGSSSEVPRIRLALRYSYYDTTAQSGDFEYNIRGLLECHGASDAELCVSGTCD